MDRNRDEIEEKFANITPGHASPLISVPEAAPAWVIRQSDGRFGVAVPYAGETVYEGFAGAELRSVKENQLGAGFPGMLMLLSRDEERRNEFSLLCGDFIDPGCGNWKRRALEERPLAWWESWSDVLGNAVRHMKPHSVVGELLIYEHLLEENTGRVSWTGPNGASHDLQCAVGNAEVKSTLRRYESIIEISGQFQLQTNEELWLYFCRLEPSSLGFSINALVKELAKRPDVRKSELNAKLAALGYEEGSSARRKRFALLEVKRYRVDDTFPRISSRSFVDGVMPPGIQRISYSIDLGILPGEPVQLKAKYYDTVTEDPARA